RGDEITPERLPEHITNYNPVRINAEFDLPDAGINLATHLDALEKTYVVEALRKTAGNQTKAADLLQMQVRSLRHLLDKHSIRSLSAQMRNGDYSRGLVGPSARTPKGGLSSGRPIRAPAFVLKSSTD